MKPLEDFLRDVRVGCRLLFRSPVFSLVAILSLAIGIGANTAIFTLINALMLRELPVPEPDRLFIATVAPSDIPQRFSYPAFEQARDQLAGRAELSAMSAIARMQLVPRAAGATPTAESGWVQLVSGEWFNVLRQRPQLGRLLTPDDNRHLGAHPVAVISDGYWSRRYGRSPAAIGSELTVNNVAFTIVGVTAPAFFGTTVATQYPDVWLPLQMQSVVRYATNASVSNADGRKPWTPQAGVQWLNIFVRVSETGTLPPLAEIMTRLYQQEMREVHGKPSDADDEKRRAAVHVELIPGNRGISNARGLQQPLVVLQIMVGFLLAIACANIASLLLARSTTRLREMAIRLSMGAGRWRLVRQMLAESLLLSIVAGALGLLLASWGSRALFALASSATDVDLSIDRRVLAFTLGVSMITGTLFGLVPALRATRVSPSDTLKTQGRAVIGDASRHPFSFGKLLLASQMALCLLLLIVAGLFARSLQALAQIDLGIDGDHVLVARVDPRAAGYATRDLAPLYRRVLDRLSTTPGIEAASMSLGGVLGGSIRSGSFAAEGYTPRPGEHLSVTEEIVTHDYVRTYGMTLVKGRSFEPQDLDATRRVSLINETLSKRYFNGRDPIGQHWSYGGPIGPDATEIIGVVRDVHYSDLKSRIEPSVYSLAVQGDRSDSDTASVPFLSSVDVRTIGPPAAMADTLRRALREAEPRLPILDVQTMTQRVSRMSRQEQLVAYLTTLFSGIALLLASLGLYGSISYAVTRRTSEIGVRMALGADRASVLWLIMRDALVLMLMGLAIGVPLALIAANGMRSMLFGIRFTDVTTHVTAAAVLVLVAATAAYLPARRAARVDPMLALRAD